MENLIAAMVGVFGSITVTLLIIVVNVVNSRFDAIGLRLSIAEDRINCVDDKLNATLLVLASVFNADPEKMAALLELLKK
ncbi:MAG: hypothetical protein D4R38_03085 [Dehalococcoidia bacterium]|nr:MAG: hypothetical protein D4R38_03085 [Dehalococcoidia bacterium]